MLVGKKGISDWCRALNVKDIQWIYIIFRSIPLHFKVYLIEIVMVGLIGGIASTYSALMDLFDPSGFTPPCYIKDTNDSSWKGFN